MEAAKQVIFGYRHFSRAVLGSKIGAWWGRDVGHYCTIFGAVNALSKAFETPLPPLTNELTLVVSFGAMVKREIAGEQPTPTSLDAIDVASRIAHVVALVMVFRKGERLPAIVGIGVLSYATLVDPRTSEKAQRRLKVARLPMSCLSTALYFYEGEQVPGVMSLGFLGLKVWGLCKQNNSEGGA